MRLPVPGTLRGRLVAACLVAAAVLIAVGVLLFRSQLVRGMRSSLDATLTDRAVAIAAEVHGQPASARIATPPVVGGRFDIESLSVLYSPDGGAYDAQPRRIPALDVDLDRARTRPLFWTAEVTGGQMRLMATPVQIGDATWVIVVGGDADPIDRSLDRVDQTLAIAGPLLLVACGLGAWWLCGAALRPVERMREEAAELSASDASGRLGEARSVRELAALARTFNALLDGLHESLARQRDLVADAGHELRTPLAVLSVELELADRSTRSPGELLDAVAHARTEVDRLSRLCEDLLFLADADADAPEVQRQDYDIAILLAEVARAHRRRAASGDVRLQVQAPARLAALVEPGSIRRALDNLVANALRHTPPGGTVTVSAWQEADEVVLQVADTGSGFPPEFLPHAFERFRRADAARSRDSDAEPSGAGLGLAIVASITKAHGGTVIAQNRPGGGAVLTVRLPVPPPDGQPVHRAHMSGRNSWEAHRQDGARDRA